jgi:hypothetical protein
VSVAFKLQVQPWSRALEALSVSLTLQVAVPISCPRTGTGSSRCTASGSRPGKGTTGSARGGRGTSHRHTTQWLHHWVAHDSGRQGGRHGKDRGAGVPSPSSGGSLHVTPPSNLNPACSAHCQCPGSCGEGDTTGTTTGRGQVPFMPADTMTRYRAPASREHGGSGTLKLGGFKSASKKKKKGPPETVT